MTVPTTQSRELLYHSSPLRRYGGPGVTIHRRGEHSGIGTVGVDTLVVDVGVQQDLHCLPVQDITAGETDDNKLHPKLQSFGQHSLSCEICCLFLPKALRTGKKMVPGKGHEGKMAPVHFFSHGSTMMLGEDSNSAKYWEKMGDLALANGLEHVIMMVSGYVSLRPGVWSIRELYGK